MMTLFNPIPTEDWMFAVPILGQHLLLAELIGGETIAPVAYFYSAASCLIIGFALVLATGRLFQRESIVAG
ncbi:MAG: hypothetical protein U5O39_07600 [Gammaproteobacteria bacterium]|nr:hypothetical protein [Gammaproteobacteria bacterium]